MKRVVHTARPMDNLYRLTTFSISQFIILYMYRDRVEWNQGASERASERLTFPSRLLALSSHNCSWHGLRGRDWREIQQNKILSPPVYFIISRSGEQVAQFLKEIGGLSASADPRLAFSG